MNPGEKFRASPTFSTGFKIFIVLLLFVMVFGSPLLDSINHKVERKRKYQNAIERVEKAGGWKALEMASLGFATNTNPKIYFDEQYFWRGERRNTNSLPPALEILQPWRIEFKLDNNGIPTLRLRLYGIHRTGMYDEPYYGIWVICTNVSPDYVPVIGQHESGMRGLIERKGSAIFEVR